MMLRPARKDDVGDIAALWNAMIRDTLATFTTVELSEADAAARIAGRADAFWVAGAPGQVAGFVTFGPFRGGPGYAATVEHTVILAASAQGKGLGHVLMDQAEDAARIQGRHIMVAAISSANPAAVRFHAARGFVVTGQMPEVGRKAGQWLDLILMQKSLNLA